MLCPRRLSPLLLVCSTLLLASCSSLSPYSSLTKLDLTLVASDRLNPDLHGRPSPIVVRLFELRHPVAFETADFFSLYERARDTLAPDLIVSEELELRPGQTRHLKLRIEQGRHVGVLAAYRDLNQARWRQVVTVSRGLRTQVELVLDQDGIAAAPGATVAGEGVQ
ncbi:type VI secretion system lipoprotein TssJ [Pseudomonas syringae]|nr:type VI secretion system lipoprotein TssJ [Pseudomonas syringae]MBD8792835.1 type VI secretion system lipoprotein TssJ [Pseudomonas syringae]MBD8803338.1 type VI secretion system lipoprotein TssJ [Pseudomonas syringae]MBD8811935.1 type VI secretion system lipoprotein TssJ [Pseudomonas syringae]